MSGRWLMADATGCNVSCNTDPDPRQARALERLLEGLAPTAVARELGVDRSTLWRWRATPWFAARYREALDERAGDAALRLDAAAGAALDLLESVIEDPAHPIAVRVRAAESVLRHSALTRPPPPAPSEARTEEEQINRIADVLRSGEPTICEALRRVGLNPEAIK